jgi:transposase
MMGIKERSFGPLRNVSLDTLVPADHFYRHVELKLDLRFVRDLVRDSYKESGRPSVDPVVFFKLQLVMFFEGIRSERELVRVAADRLSVRWYLGYDLHEALPEHSSLTRIRERYGLAVFQRFFERVVDLCEQAGLIWGKELIFDGTKVRANAATDSLRSRWFMESRAHLRALFEGSASGRAPWQLPEPDEGSNAPPTPAPGDLPATDLPAQDCADEPPRLPLRGSPELERQLAAANEATWRILEERRREPGVPSGSRGYQRTSDAMVSRTDPDAAPMASFVGDRARLGYHDHYVVDGGKARIILQALVTPADVMDNTPMLDLLHRARFRWKLRPERAVGDAKYGTVDNIRGLEDAGVRAFVPLAQGGRRGDFYGPDRFRFDPERDEYRCPQDHRLTFERVKWTEDVAVYRADPATCARCPVLRECTDSDRGRIIHRSLFSAYLDRVKGYHETEAYKRAMRKRKVWVEPLFGEAKDWHGLRRFRLRGLWKVNTEGLLIAAGQNLKRLLAKGGWGRRPWPGGAPGVRIGTFWVVVHLGR